MTTKKVDLKARVRVSVQEVESLGGHFATLCLEFDFYEVRKNIIIIFQKEKGNTFTLLTIFTVKSLPKEQNSTNLPEKTCNHPKVNQFLGD